MSDPCSFWSKPFHLGNCLKEIDQLIREERDKRLVSLALTAINSQVSLPQDIEISEHFRKQVAIVQDLYVEELKNSSQERLRKIWATIIYAVNELDGTEVSLEELAQMVLLLTMGAIEIEDPSGLILDCIQIVKELKGTRISWETIKKLATALNIGNTTGIDKVGLIVDCIKLEKELGDESDFLATIVKLAPTLFTEKMGVWDKMGLIVACFEAAKKLKGTGISWVEIVKLASLENMSVWEKEDYIQAYAAAASELKGMEGSLTEIVKLALSPLTADIKGWNKIDLILECAKAVKRQEEIKVSLTVVMELTQCISLLSEKISGVDKIDLVLRCAKAIEALEKTDLSLEERMDPILSLLSKDIEERKRAIKLAQSLFTEKMSGVEKISLLIVCIFAIKELKEEEVSWVFQALMSNQKYSLKLFADLLNGIGQVPSQEDRESICKIAHWIVPIIADKQLSRTSVCEIIQNIAKIDRNDRENVCKLASAKLIGDDFFSEKSITNILHQIANMQKKNRESALVITILTPPDLGGYTLPAALKNIEEKTRALGVYSPFYPADPTLAQVLNQEVNEILQEIRQRKSSDDLPIPQEIIRIVLESRERAIEQNQPNPYPALTGILGRAEIIAKKSDALFLPGGEDIPESLYRRDVPLLTDTDYRRSLLEIALIHESLKRGIPLMGVCRGFQMANVYFGAGLNNVAGQDEPQLLTIQIPKGSGWLDKALQSSIMGICLHQQSVTQSNIATEYLEYPIFHEGIAKAASPQHAAAAPMILLQFHPELVREEMIQANVSYAGNLLFWKVLQNSAQTYRNKKKVLLEQSMEGKKD